MFLLSRFTVCLSLLISTSVLAAPPSAPLIIDTGVAGTGVLAATVPDDGLPLVIFQGVGAVIMAYKCFAADCSSGGSLSSLVPLSARRIRVALGADGLPVIGLSIANSGLRMLKCSNPSCAGGTVLKILDSTNLGGVADHDLIVPPDGLPIFAYNDGNNGDLKVARCNDGGCTSVQLSIVDSVGSVGTAPAIALVNGLPQIAYDANANTLRLAICSDMACSRSASFVNLVADNPDDTAMLTSRSGAAMIAYKHDVALGDSLKLVQCNNSACTAPIVRQLDQIEFGLGLGDGVEMIAGADGLPVLSYVDQSLGTVKLLRCARQDCATSTITTLHAPPNAVLSTNAATALTLTAQGTPLVGYGVSAGSLTLSVCNTRGCL
ncbi:MAG: hypothetical protein AB7E72_10035 [Lysobacterales bacterium]